jgi:hypothetical protein
VGVKSARQSCEQCPPLMLLAIITVVAGGCS